MRLSLLISLTLAALFLFLLVNSLILAATRIGHFKNWQLALLKGKPSALVILRAFSGWQQPAAGEKIGYQIAGQPVEVGKVERLVYEADQTAYLVASPSSPTAFRLPADLVIGKVVSESRAIGQLVSWLRKPIGLIIGLALPVATIIILEIRQLAFRVVKENQTHWS